MLADRSEAGRLLAQRVRELAPHNPIVFGLPRGGVPVAAEVAQALGAPLDVVFVRKLGAPFQPELAIGAIFDGDPPTIVRNDRIIQELDLGDGDINAEAQRQLALIAERRKAYGRGPASASLAGRTAIVVDDGAATGATLRVAVQGLRRQQAGRLIAAVPVASRSALTMLRAEADEAVCLRAPRAFGAVGYYYEDFSEVRDEDVIALLEAADARLKVRGERGGPAPAA